jgi:hypothetical protein
MGLLGDLGKKLLKVVDNPLTRAGLGISGLSGVGGLLSSAAGNQAAANAQLGAAFGSIYQGGQAATPVFNPAVQKGKQMLLGNSLFPSIPGISQSTKQGLANAATLLAPPGMQYVPTGTKRRRMNPANIKAARRAIRRIRSTRRVLQRIERLLPTRTVHSRRK